MKRRSLTVKRIAICNEMRVRIPHCFFYFFREIYKGYYGNLKNIRKVGFNMNEKMKFTVEYTGINAIIVPMLICIGLSHTLLTATQKTGRFLKDLKKNRKSKGFQMQEL